MRDPRVQDRGMRWTAGFGVIACNKVAAAAFFMPNADSK
jgi:hypothetical protein